MQTAAATILELPALEHDLDPDEVDRRLQAIAFASEQSDAALAFYLFEVEVRRLFYGFGHRSTVLYAEEKLGKSPSIAWRCLRAARACARSPLLSEAFERGEVPLYKVDALKEVLGRGEVEAWVALAKDPTISDLKLRSLVKRRLGEEPDDTFVWFRVQLTPSQHRLLHAALEKTRRYAGHQIGDAEGLEAMAADYLNAVHDESERDLELIRLDPVIPRQPRTDHQGDPDGSCRPATPIGKAPMLDDPIERDRRYRLVQLWSSGWRCEICGALCDLQVDHTESRAQAPLRRWDEENAATLCAGCHALKTHGIIRTRRLPDARLEVRRPERWNRPPMK